MEKLINLNSSERIAISKTRHCYMHPDDPNKVIKVVVNAQESKKRLDANLKEWLYFQRLMREFPFMMEFIPKYYGLVSTNIGRGLVSECVRDYDCKISVRLQEVVSGNVKYDLAQIEQRLDALVKTIVKHNIQLFDLNKFNILIKAVADGLYSPVIIDVKGPYNNYEFIPFSTYIPYFSRRKLSRRGKRLMELIRATRKDQDVAEEKREGA